MAKKKLDIVSPPAEVGTGKGKGKGNGKGTGGAKGRHPAPPPHSGDEIAPETADGMDKVAAAVMAGVEPGVVPGPGDGFALVAPPDWSAPHAPGTVIMVPPEEIDTNPQHNGRGLDMSKVKEYADDYAARIKAGDDPQLQECAGYYPAGVDKIRLVFGFHRAAAAERYNKKYPDAPMGLRVRVVPEPTSLKALVDNWAENKHHNSLSPVAEMRYMVRLIAVHGLEQKAVAKTLRVSPSLVSLRLKLCDLPESVLRMVEDGVLPVKAAYAIASMEDAEKRAAVIEKAVAMYGGLEDVETIRKTKLPKVETILAAIDSANAGGEGETAPGAAPEAATGAVPVTPNVPKPVSTKKAIVFLTGAAKLQELPLEVRAVLRAVLGWQLGQRTPAAMVKALGKALGYELKPEHLGGLGGGSGGGKGKGKGKGGSGDGDDSPTPNPTPAAGPVPPPPPDDSTGGE